MVLSECVVPVNEALAALERDENGLWSLPLVRTLESQSVGKALDWSCAVMSEVLHAKDGAASVRQEWLSELLEQKRSRRLSESLVRRAREIWYHENNRDDVQTAIARLYEGLAALQSNDIPGYRKCVAMAVGVVAGSSTAENGQVQRTIELFREKCEEAHDQDGE